MLICRFLSFSLFLYAFIPAISCKKKVNENDLQTGGPIPVTALAAVRSQEPVLVTNNESSSPCNEDLNEDLEASCEELNLGDESISQIVDNFVQCIESFWQETRRNLNEYRKRKLPPGQWWLKEVESDYRTMKENFFSCLSPDTPQQCLEILADYEVRYNDIMWAELEKEIKRIQSFGESDDEDIGDAKDFSREDLSQKPTYNYVEETLDDAYSTLQTKEVNPLSASGNPELNTKGVCKKLTFEELLFEGQEKKVTPLYCGEGTPDIDAPDDGSGAAESS